MRNLIRVLVDRLHCDNLLCVIYITDVSQKEHRLLLVKGLVKHTYGNIIYLYRDKVEEWVRDSLLTDEDVQLLVDCIDPKSQSHTDGLEWLVDVIGFIDLNEIDGTYHTNFTGVQWLSLFYVGLLSPYSVGYPLADGSQNVIRVATSNVERTC